MSNSVSESSTCKFLQSKIRIAVRTDFFRLHEKYAYTSREKMNMMLQAGNPITATKNFRFQSRSILLSRSSEITCSSSQRLFP
ncbi:MAG: hypothetical protein DBX53_03020 [Clostridiales bacterium]|nr:MAG: hypothetical protein DBX53_03020 [Clostridiales bacterium]